MNCPTCGKGVSDSDSFCKHCGGRVAAGQGASRSAAVDDMVAEYRNALVEEPNDPAALYNVGLGLLYCSDYGAAADAFRRVTDLLPDDPAAYEKLAVVLVKLDRRDEALEYARKAHALGPDRDSIDRLLKALEG